MSMTSRNPAFLAIAVLCGMVVVIAAVLGFQHIGGYIPCKLCLAQREPYYTAMPVALFALIALAGRWPRCISTGLLAIVGLLMIYTAALAGFHSGVEWAWWLGPADCGATAGNISSNVGDLLGDLTAKRAPSCTEAAGRFLGLSFAGWNVLASLGLAAIAFRGAAMVGSAHASSSVSQ